MPQGAFTLAHDTTIILIITGIPSPLTFSFQTENLTFLQILPAVVFLSSSGLTKWITQTVYYYFSACPFLLFSFSVCFTLFSCRFRAKD